MSLSDIKDKFSYLFKITSFLYRPYLRLTYEEQKGGFLQKFFVWFGTWASIAIFYLLFIYFFVYDPPDGAPRTLKYVFENPSLIALIKDFAAAFSEQIYLNSVFVVVLYFAIISTAEADYLKARFIHGKLLGLVKVVKAGKFDSSSYVKEQEEAEVYRARRNIYDIVVNREKEIIKIITPSGFDLFAEGHPLGKKEDEDEVKKRGFLGRLRRKGRKHQHLNNGYLLDIIKERGRTVEILLLKPDSKAAMDRGGSYTKHDAHKAVTSKDEYENGINSVIENLREAHKRNKNIYVKTIEEIPRWKIILVESEVMVQPVFEGVRSDHTPLYVFKKSDYSMYHTYFNIFYSLWHSVAAKDVDLESKKIEPASAGDTIAEQKADTPEI